MPSVKVVLVLEVDVTGASSPADAREMAFELARPLLVPSKKRGPKVSGPRAVVTGVRADVLSSLETMSAPIVTTTLAGDYRSVAETHPPDIS